MIFTLLLLYIATIKNVSHFVAKSDHGVLAPSMHRYEKVKVIHLYVVLLCIQQWCMQVIKIRTCILHISNNWGEPEQAPHKSLLRENRCSMCVCVYVCITYLRYVVHVFYLCVHVRVVQPTRVRPQ